MSARVGAAVLHWESPNQAIRAVESLLRSRGVALDVIVIDNASSERSFAMLKSRLPKVRIVRSPTNQGYAGGMNLALNVLDQGQAEFFLLVTQDVVVDPDMVRKLLDVMRSEPSAGIVGPVVYYMQEPECVFSAGGYVNLVRVMVGHFNAPLGSKPYEVNWIDGCCMLVRRQTVRAIGGFDDSFFMYYEENDFCQRARRLGWKVVVAPSAQAWHEATLGRRSLTYHYYMSRNAYLYWHRNFGLGFLVVARKQVGSLVRQYAAAILSLVVWRLRARQGVGARLANAIGATKGFIMGSWNYLRGARRWVPSGGK